MAREHSYGIVAFHEGKVLLVQHRAGHWGFPKGHAQTGETPLEAAEREFREETGISAYRVLNLPPLVETYIIERKNRAVTKDVTYFLARVDDPRGRPQEEELVDLQWLDPEAAGSRITYPQSREILARALAATADSSSS